VERRWLTQREMELGGGSRLRDLAGSVKELQVPPRAACLGDEPCEVKFSTWRELRAQRAHDHGQVVEQVGEPEAQDGGEPCAGNGSAGSSSTNCVSCSKSS